MVEREGETAVLAAALTALAAGRGATVVVAGPAGIGRSRLLEWLVGRTRDHGLPILAARGRELERAETGAVERELLAAAGGVLPGAAHVLVVDDAQWVDAASLRLIAGWAAGAAEHPALVVVALTDGEAPQDAEAARWLATAPDHRTVRPAPLSPAGVGRLVAARHGRTLDAGGLDRLTAAIARRTAGHPSLVAALLDGPRAGGPDPAPPPAVVEAIAGRLARAGAAATAVAQATAVLDGDAHLRHVARVGGLPGADATQEADRLAALGLVAPGEPLRFAAPLVAEAVTAGTPPFTRAQLHRRAAEALAAEGAPAAAVAAHLMRATPAADPKAVAALRAAAEDAGADGDTAGAVGLLARALGEPPDPAARPSVLLELAAVEVLEADPRAEDHVDEALRAAVDDPPVHLAALVARARLRQQRGDHAGADRALQRALDAAPEGDSALDALLADHLTATVLDAGRRSHARPRLGALLAAVAAGEAPRHPGLAAHAALECALRGGRPAQVRALAQAALARDPLVDPASHGILLGIVVQALACVDELAFAESVATAGLRAADEAGAVIAASTAGFHRAIPRLHRGALDEALADLQVARRASSRGWEGGDRWIGALVAHVQLERGETQAAEAALALLAASPPDDLGTPLGAVARARVALASGDARTALDLAEAAGEALTGRFGIVHPGLAPWRALAAESAHALGNASHARRRAEEAVGAARATEAPRSVGRALRALAAVGTRQERIGLLEEAVAALASSDARLEQAHAQIALGAARREAGDRAGAQEALRRGLQLAATAGAAPLAERAQVELRATGARPRRAAVTGVDALTASERRVADLAATGLANQEIADTLVVTVKTVQTHLTNAYRKLGITSRRELPAALGGQAA